MERTKEGRKSCKTVYGMIIRVTIEEKGRKRIREVKQKENM